MTGHVLNRTIDESVNLLATGFFSPNIWPKMISMSPNTLKEIRESLLVSKAELARKAKVSPITISRIEKGLPCRMETKRKILLALELQLSDKDKIFGS